MKSLALVCLCSCMPYALPPVTGDVGLIHTSASGSRTGIHADVGFAPVQLSRSFLHRSWDAALGGSFDRTTHNTWGGWLAAGPIFHPWGLDSKSNDTQRVLPQLVGRWTTDNTALGLRLSTERGTFVNGSGSSSDGGAAGYGEGAIGLFAELDRTWADRNGWALLVGITVRSPFIVGIACCFK